MKKISWSWWCDRAWIKFGCLITVCMMALMLWNWNSWGNDLKVICAISALIPMHVVEEWIFPGGFHYQYNVGLFHSEQPNCYPMCRLSDMYTNLIATFLYMALTFISMFNGNHVYSGMLLGTIAFSALELFMHTLMGIKMYLKFKRNGKTTIYGPGSFTAYFGFVILGIIAFFCLDGVAITTIDWLICIGILACIGIGCILIPESIIKQKNSVYYFESAGYFERFL